MVEAGGLWSYTKQYHHRPYPAIDPTRPELSAEGKTVFITGGGKNIGGAIAESFAKARAKNIILTGRTKETLESFKHKLETSYPHSRIHTFGVDITDADALHTVFQDVAKHIGRIDVLISNAGYSQSDLVADGDVKGFWQTFSVNTIGALNVIQGFLKHAAVTENPVLISTNSGMAHLAPLWGPCASYAASKAATAKIHEYLAAEQPQLRVYSMQPGIIPTDLSMGGTGMSAEEFPDVAELPGAFAVWLASPEATFLRGRYVWANWDVEELKERKEEILADPSLFTLSLGGWGR